MDQNRKLWEKWLLIIYINIKNNNDQGIGH